MYEQPWLFGYGCSYSRLGNLVLIAAKSCMTGDIWATLLQCGSFKLESAWCENRVFCVMRRLGGLDTNSQPGAKTETSVLSTDKTFTSAFSSIQQQDDACLGAEVGKFAFLQCTRN